MHLNWDLNGLVTQLIESAHGEISLAEGDAAAGPVQFDLLAVATALQSSFDLVVILREQPAQFEPDRKVAAPKSRLISIKQWLKFCTVREAGLSSMQLHRSYGSSIETTAYATVLNLLGKEMEPPTGIEPVTY